MWQWIQNPEIRNGNWIYIKVIFIIYSELLAVSRLEKGKSSILSLQNVVILLRRF